MVARKGGAERPLLRLLLLRDRSIFWLGRSQAGKRHRQLPNSPAKAKLTHKKHSIMVRPDAQLSFLERNAVGGSCPNNAVAKKTKQVQLSDFKNQNPRQYRKYQRQQREIEAAAAKIQKDVTKLKIVTVKSKDTASQCKNYEWGDLGW